MKVFLLFLSLFYLTFTNTNANIEEINNDSIKNLNFLEKEATVLVFISKDCPCSNRNLDYISKLKNEFPDFKFLGIHANKNVTKESLESYLTEKKLSFSVLNDSSFLLTKKYEALKTPHVFIVGKNEEILYNGGVSNSTFPENASEFYLKNALLELKAGKKISKQQTKALGCFIMR